MLAFISELGGEYNKRINGNDKKSKHVYAFERVQSSIYMFPQSFTTDEFLISDNSVNTTLRHHNQIMHTFHFIRMYLFR